MKIGLAQLNYHIGNFEGNYSKIKAAIDLAAEAKADLLIFSELAVSGYPPRDFLEFSDFIRLCEETTSRIASDTKRTGVAVLVGCPTRNPHIEGKDLFNSALLIAGGEVIHTANKALLPTYDIFDEYRYFEPATEFSTVDFKGMRLAITVCEDIWNVGNNNPLYRTCPMDELIKQKPELIINISASPFDHSQREKRLAVIRANNARYKLPMLYCNHVGAQTELIFDGASLIVNEAGRVVDELPFFEEAIRFYESDRFYQSRNPVQSVDEQKGKYELIHDALVMGIRDYFRKLGFRQAIVGLSGGVDSALTLVLAVKALGSENVRALFMPSRYTSTRSVDDARKVAENLAVRYDSISIEDVYKVTLDVLPPYFDRKEEDVTEQNIQARIRMIYLMAMSNKNGYILLNTSNKSENAVGYGTLYGDMAGGLSVLGDLYKTDIYRLCEFINRQRKWIPDSILTRVPTAELKENQTDEDDLPPYHILDRVLYEYIEQRKSPREIVAMGHDEKLVARILKLVNTSEYKRHQTPPMLRVSPKAFGMGRRVPIVGKYLS
jgi:NAD+ synthase (glutamine-hydrolysing)